MLGFVSFACSWTSPRTDRSAFRNALTVAAERLPGITLDFQTRHDGFTCFVTLPREVVLQHAFEGDAELGHEEEVAVHAELTFRVEEEDYELAMFDQEETDTCSFLGLASNSSGEVFAVGDGCSRYHAHDWECASLERAATLLRVVSTEPSSAWAVGEEGIVVRYAPHTWEMMARPAARTLVAVDRAPGGDVWVVAEAGLVERFDGERWVTMGSPAEHATDIWSTSADEAIVVGPTPAALFHHRDGLWRSLPIDCERPTLVAGAASDDLWVAASNELLHFDGRTWSHFETNVDVPTALRVASSRDIWLGGDTGELWHWAGETWSAVPIDFDSRINDVCPRGGEVWLASQCEGGVAIFTRAHTHFGFDSAHSSNREAWGALAVLCEHVATLVDAVPEW